MKIYNPSGEVLIETVVSDRSGLYKSIDNREELTLQFSLDRHVDIPVGSWCNFEGARYEVMSLPDVKMINTKNYSYTVVLASNFSKTAMYIVRNPVDGRIKFDLTAKPIEHLRLIVDNLNQREGGWSVGSCIESVEKLVSYNQVGCDLALVNIADVFETEVEVKGKVINLGKVEYFKDSPLALSYGKGKGFKTGILRTGDNGGLPTHKVFVIGGSRNISLKDYGSKELHLPVKLSFGFDGEFFDGEVGYSYLKAKPFVTDEKGSFVMIDDNTTSGKEDCIDLSDVYPSRVGKVTGVVYVYQGKDYEILDPSWTEEQLNEVQVDFIDDTIPDNLDYNECLIENGEPLTVIFQTGMLAGREFSATYVSDKKRFELQKQEFDGLPMPQGAFIPSVPDSYAVFNVSMPSTYISDPSTYSGAEFDILREASRVLYESSSLKFSFTGELDGIWAKKNWEKVSPRIRIGSYVSFVHEKMFPDEPAVVRIVGITQYVNNPHSPKIEISNSIGSSSLSSRISALENNGAHVEELFEESKRYTKRRFSDVKHTIEMLAGAFENFSDGIDPVTVETMLAAIGDESLQYVFTKSLESDDPADFSYSYDEKTKVFSVPDAFIKHMTLGIDSISPVHSEDEYMRWAVSGVTSEALADKDKGYYLYAVVKKNSTTGEFKLLESPVMLEEVDGYYHLLVGILNKEFADSRSFACLFGFTEILPGQIVTESIRSSDGKTWIDLLRGILHLNDMAGVSGVKTDSKGDQSIAAWFGGLMQDKELDDDATNPAKSVIRHDGTGYFADGLFKWDKDHGVNLGNDSIKINYDGSVEFGPNIKISTEGDETLGSVLTLIAELKDMFYKYDDNTIGTRYAFFSEKQVAAGGVGAPGSGEGGEEGGGGSGIGLLLTTWPADNGDYSSYALGGNLGIELNKRLTAVESDYALKSDLETLTKRFDRYFDGIDDSDIYVNKWHELVDFLKGIEEGEDLAATLLGHDERIQYFEDMFEWVLDESGNRTAIRARSHFFSTGQVAAGGIGEESGSGGGGGISLLFDSTKTWADYTSDMADYALAAYHGKALNDRLVKVEGRATDVSFTQTLLTGKPIGTIMVNGESQTMYAPASYSADDIVPTQERNFVSLQDIEYWNTAYLPKTGGTLRARLTIAAGSDKKIVLNNTDNDNKYQFISFQQNGTEYGQLGTAGSDDLMWGKEGYEKVILHSGNIGSYKAGDSAKLAGVNAGRYAVLYTTYLTSDTDANSITNPGFYINATGNGSGNSNFPSTYGKLFSWGGTYGFTQMHSDVITGALSFRCASTNLANAEWKTIAFTDSDITGNAATATKLATARTLWGQSFDGTENVNGPLFFNQGQAALYTQISGIEGDRFFLQINPYGHLLLGQGLARAGKDSFLYGNNISLCYGTAGSSSNTALLVNSSGNVTIGSSDLAGTAQKLCVGGPVKINGSIYFGVDTITMYGYDSSDSSTVNALYLSSVYKQLQIGHGTAANGYNTYLYGNELHLRYGTSRTTGLILNSSGNVGIGTTSPEYKLDVNGTARFNGNIVLASDFTVNATTGYVSFGINGALIKSDVRDSWRSTVFGNAGAGSRIKTVRTDVTINNFSEIYGNGLAWASGDTHGYIGVSYGSKQAFIGGGSSDKLSWTAKLFHNNMTLEPYEDKIHQIGSASKRYTNAYLSNSVRIGNAVLSWDSTNNALKIEGNVYATGQVASGGIGTAVATIASDHEDRIAQLEAKVESLMS